MMYWTKEQLRSLQAIYRKFDIRRTTAEFNSRWNMNLPETCVRACTRNHGILSGRSGRFVKGQVSWNTGKKGIHHGSCTSFKKGNIPANIKPLGSERLDTKDGYILMKVAQKNPHTGAPTRYLAKHIVLWEKWHGPVPKGKAVFFKDGNRRNFRKTNLVLVTRAELAMLNRRGYGAAPKQIKPALFTLSRLEARTFELERKR